MSHMIIELILWMLLAFFIGCILGYLARRWFVTEPVKVDKATAMETSSHPAVEPSPAKRDVAPEPPKVTLEPVSTIVAAPVEPPAPAVRPTVPQEAMPVAAETSRPERPKGIPEARSGKADDLQRISGIGPKYERTLHNLGFYHFDQIAMWTNQHVGWVDDHLKFNGRIQREEWVVQARLLAEGKEEEFFAKYGTGGQRNRAGESKSGSRTRRR